MNETALDGFLLMVQKSGYRPGMRENPANHEIFTYILPCQLVSRISSINRITLVSFQADKKQRKQ